MAPLARGVDLALSASRGGSGRGSTRRPPQLARRWHASAVATGRAGQLAARSWASADRDPLHAQVSKWRREGRSCYPQGGCVVPRHALVVSGLGAWRRAAGAAVDVVSEELVVADGAVGQVDHCQPHLGRTPGGDGQRGRPRTPAPPGSRRARPAGPVPLSIRGRAVSRSPPVARSVRQRAPSEPGTTHRRPPDRLDGAGTSTATRSPATCDPTDAKGSGSNVRS